jgi:hypothetical protein
MLSCHQSGITERQEKRVRNFVADIRAKISGPSDGRDFYFCQPSPAAFSWAALGL